MLCFGNERFRIQRTECVQRAQVLLAVNHPPMSQLLYGGLCSDGCEYVVKCFPLGAVHLNLTASDHGHLQSLRYVVTMLETSPFIVAQQPADTDPHPAFAPLRQLLKVHALIVGVVRQENEQATFEVKDHIAQIHDVFPFPGTTAGATDQPR